MHDVTKRGLALAVATGGLLITGAAPAVSAVSTHPPDHPGEKSQPTSGSSHPAAILVSGSQVKQYAGRHKAPGGHAAPQHTAAPHQNAAAHPQAAPRHGTPGQGRVMPAPPVPGPGHGYQFGADLPGSEAGASAQASDVGGGGLLAGNTIEVPVDAPVNACGLVATVVGGGDRAAGEQCVNGPGVAGGPTSSASAASSDNPGALSGNIVQVPVSLPTNVCGDTVTVVGGHDSAEDILCANNGGPSSSTAQAVATDSPGLVNGNVVQVPVDAPLNVCGITADVAGVYDSAAGNTCVNGGGPVNPGMPANGAGAQAVTAGSSGAITGNVVQVPIEAPINACGDSVSLVGVFGSALGNSCVNNTAGGATATATGDDGLGTGNIAQLPINIPTAVCGVGAAVGGYHATAEGNTCANTGAATTASSVGIPPPPPADCVVPSQPLPPPPVGPLPPLPQPPPPALPPLAPAPLLPAAPPPQPPRAPLQYYTGNPGGPSPEEVGQLPHTGADVLGYAGIGAGALVLGAGAVIAARRKSSGSAS